MQKNINCLKTNKRLYNITTAYTMTETNHSAFGLAKLLIDEPVYSDCNINDIIHIAESLLQQQAYFKVYNNPFPEKYDLDDCIDLNFNNYDLLTAESKNIDLTKLIPLTNNGYKKSWLTKKQFKAIKNKIHAK
jgi:hypothetical protein